MKFLFLILTWKDRKGDAKFPPSMLEEWGQRLFTAAEAFGIFFCYSLGVWESFCLSVLPPTRSFTEICECLWSFTLPNIYTSNQEFRHCLRQSVSWDETNFAQQRQWEVIHNGWFYITSLFQTPLFPLNSVCVMLCSEWCLELPVVPLWP